MLKFDSSHKSVNGDINKISGIVKKVIIAGAISAMVLTFSGCRSNSEEDLKYYHDAINNYYSEELDENSDRLILTENCKYDDLFEISLKYPNITKIYISLCPNVDSLDFIYNFPNLKEVNIDECPYVTQELIDYLNSKGIKHNLTSKNIEVTNKVNEIVNEIISEDMDDKEKIQAICTYIIENYKYNINLTDESNIEPLTCFLDNGAGVCKSFSYLTSVLLTKANVENYTMFDNDHAWNMVKLDDKYYYIDTTNIGQIPLLSDLLLKKLNIGLYYMSDPGKTAFSAMSDYDSTQVVIPQELIDDIKKGEEEKNIIEKYRVSLPASIICVIISLVVVSLGIKSAKALAESAKYKKERKKYY